jgi:hypothetical protein
LLAILPTESIAVFLSIESKVKVVLRIGS